MTSVVFAGRTLHWPEWIESLDGPPQNSAPVATTSRRVKKRKAHAKSSTKQTKVKTYEAMIVEPQIIHEVDMEVGHSLPVHALVEEVVSEVVVTPEPTSVAVQPQPTLPPQQELERKVCYLLTKSLAERPKEVAVGLKSFPDLILRWFYDF
jgi:hypothetical protein